MCLKNKQQALNTCCPSLLMVVLLSDLLGFWNFSVDTPGPLPGPWPPWAERKGKGCWPWSQSPCGAPESQPQLHGEPRGLSLPVNQTQRLEVQAWPKGSRFQNTPLLAAFHPPPLGLCSRLPRALMPWPVPGRAETIRF